MARTLITNGTVISPTGRQLIDVLIDGETIVAMYAPGQVQAQGITAETVIDATGKYVIPGGIDVHTHMELPFGGTNASDTFETGSRAAAWGGVTTIVDFVSPDCWRHR
jgi:dihydropyrimidinase